MSQNTELQQVASTVRIKEKRIKLGHSEVVLETHRMPQGSSGKCLEVIPDGKNAILKIRISSENTPNCRYCENENSECVSGKYICKECLADLTRF